VVRRLAWHSVQDFLAGRSKIYAPAMLGVAGGAVGRARLISVMDWAVMAREASLILDLR